MTPRHRCSLAVAGLLALSSSLAVAQSGAPMVPVAERVAAQNKLFADVYANSLRNNPLYATAMGDLEYNAELGDYSLAHIAHEHAESDAFLARLKAISTDGMPEQDTLSHLVLERQFTTGDTAYELKNYEMPVNQQNGIHTDLAANLVQTAPLDTVQHYEDYIARLRQIPRVFDQVTGVMRAGMRDGLMPPKFLLEKLPQQCDGVIAADPFALAIKKMPASFSDAEKQKLTAEINDAIQTQVFPAYRKFATFLREEYAPKGRTALSVESLPDGKARYAFAVRSMTTIDVSPQEVHALGLSEVKRITAEMDALARKQGYKSVAEFREAIHKDPRWTPKNGQQIVDDFRKHIEFMQPKLPQLFNLLPKTPVTVEAMPPYQAAAATHYSSGSPDGKRAGRVVVAVSDPTHRTLVDDEAVAYHEGVPGHHLQISDAQQLKGLPKFRQSGHGFTAYTEGWALYAEELGKEVGGYQDPVSDYGRLNSELFRAVRLVVDTGIHNLGWSRDQVIQYMAANDVTGPQAQSETDRYIAWPGQALAYKMGQLKIRELRDRAKAQLGPRFDIRAFHDEIIDAGALPLDLLDARVSRWITAQQPQNASAAQPAAAPAQ